MKITKQKLNLVNCSYKRGEGTGGGEGCPPRDGWLAFIERSSRGTLLLIRTPDWLRRALLTNPGEIN